MKLKKEEIIDRFSTMIRFKTVSCPDRRGTDRDVFIAFRNWLKEAYPDLFSYGEALAVGDYGLLIRIPGKSGNEPAVLMAHYDVVGADPEGWSADPFGAERRDGRIYGRGTLDTKCTLCSILEAVSYHIRNGFVPEHDIWLSFGGEEEVCGETCSAIVSFLGEKGVRPSFVLDEGGAVIPEGVPGYRHQVAMIGAAEKGEVNFLLTCREGNGGHASVPPKTTVIGRLAKAAVAIEKHPFPGRLSTPVTAMFRHLSGEVPFYEKPVFMFPEILEKPLVSAASILGGSFNAMVRSTAAVTVISSTGGAFNVLPGEAAMGVNVRLLEGDTVASAEKRLRRLIRDPSIRIEVMTGDDPSPTADTDCGAYRKLTEVIRRVWPGTPSVPYQMNGGTDARFYRVLTDRIYRFTPMIMTEAERRTVHGADESISEENLLTMIRFYIELTAVL